jgi:hypothetical protein
MNVNKINAFRLLLLCFEKLKWVISTDDECIFWYEGTNHGNGTSTIMTGADKLEKIPVPCW